jgi:hypothetical protein
MIKVGEVHTDMAEDFIVMHCVSRYELKVTRLVRM